MPARTISTQNHRHFRLSWATGSTQLDTPKASKNLAAIVTNLKKQGAHNSRQHICPQFKSSSNANNPYSVCIRYIQHSSPTLSNTVTYIPRFSSKYQISNYTFLNNQLNSSAIYYLFHTSIIIYSEPTKESHTWSKMDIQREQRRCICHQQIEWDMCSSSSRKKSYQYKILTQNTV